ncbi:flagellar basal-body MS-ring/collar protein FliF [Sphingomonas sp.]|uniref:flagellar basal-body MS-ring/collar protein FliF n=1 Tax=Sphingomonas sp. TaxID=28214 RepID=UPI002D0603A7|nr:flagellar basal-body MS-ring/collar protein FliF [Sphingomonas sp.]HWK36607.1 flagellar basal-body MS-ring/collar protein FliF [Sphingomonas sp.]
MATQLAPVPQPGNPLAGRFANPLKQVTGLLGQPAVKRSLPLIFMVGLVLAAALAWSMLRQPPQKVLFPNLADSDKAAVVQALKTASIDADVDDSGSVTVAEDDYHKARMLLASQDLPKSAPGGYALLDQLPMGVSRAVEGERLRQARETELAKSIEEIDTVADARVHLATPESTVFVRDRAAPSASVIVKLQSGRSLADSQVRSIVNLVASSVPGMKPDAVTIVDQMGTLLSKPGAGASSTEAGDARIAFQRQVEDKVRAQISQLLTPLLGVGNFTAEVQADVDLDETQATRESYEKQGAVRAEQGNWTGNQPASALTPPGGIPGALSNTPPAPATLALAQGQQPAPNAPGTSPATPAGPVTDAMKQTDSYARAYDLGKEVSVTRAAPGGIKRLSVAVLLREPDKGRRTALEIQQITGLVQAAVGYTATRNDQVTVLSKKFSGGDDAAPAPAWYQAEWLPMVLRNVTAVVIALLVLLLGVRPLARGLMKKREDAVAGPRLAFANPDAQSGADSPVDAGGPVTVEMLDNARGYDDRVGLVRGFTRENPTRAALAVRDMIKSEGAQ